MREHRVLIRDVDERRQLPRLQIKKIENVRSLPNRNTWREMGRCRTRHVEVVPYDPTQLQD